MRIEKAIASLELISNEARNSEVIERLKLLGTVQYICSKLRVKGTSSDGSGNSVENEIIFKNLRRYESSFEAICELSDRNGTDLEKHFYWLSVAVCNLQTQLTFGNRLDESE